MDTATGGPPDVARGKPLEKTDQHLVLAIPGTEYQLHLDLPAPLKSDVGKPVSGRIIAKARRIDATVKGGSFIEPLYGRPRRLQGRVIASDPGANTITVRAGNVPFICQLLLGQKAADVPTGAFVGFDVERGARFEPVTPT